MRRKRWIPLFVLSLLLVLFSVWFLTPGYYCRERIGPPSTVLWRDDEAYVLLAIERRIAHASRLWLFLENVTADLGNPFVASEGLFADLILFRIQHDKLDKFYLENFPRAGTTGMIYPHSNQVYYARATLHNEQEFPLIWRWTGTNFEKLTHEEAVRVSDSLDPASWKKDGWTLVNPVMTPNGEYHDGVQTWAYRESKSGPQQCTCSMTLGGKNLTLTFRVDRPRKILLLQGLNEDGETPLIKLDQSWKTIDKAQYEKLLPTISDD